MEHKELQIGSDLDAESEQVEIIGIHTLCRLCATQNDRLMGIYSEEGITNDLSNKINLYLPVKVAETDDLPLQCCWNCATTLLAWHELVVTSVEIDRKFRNSQFIADKQTTETEGFDHPETGISDDNDGCDDEGLAAAEGNIVALFNHIKKEPTDPQPKQLMAPNQCEICEKLLSCRSNYLSHVKTHVSDNYCRLCCNSYNTKFKLNSHSTSHKDGKDAPQTFVQCDFEDCLLQFPSKLQLHHHKNTHFNVTTFQCEICGRQFWKKSALESHGLKHEKKISCKVCGKVLSSKKTLRDHRRLHTGEKPYKCRHCDEVFRCQSGLKYHEVIHSGVKKYRCQLCGMNFLRSNYLKGHLRIHAKEKPYQCQHCNEKFGQMGVLKRHEARMHIKCGLCEAVVGRRGNLKEHMWKVHDTKYKLVIDEDLKPLPGFCPICQTTISRARDLRRHISSCHPDPASSKKFDDVANLTTKTCTECNTSFENRTQLKKHVEEVHKLKQTRHRRRKNEISPQFYCDVCEKGFTRKHDMEKHRVQVHSLATQSKENKNLEVLTKCRNRDSDGKLFYCCDYCQRRFTQSYNLMRHRTIHTGVKEFFCHICGVGFRMSNGLKRHIEASHNRVKNYKCEVCNKSFNAKATRDEHLNIHTDNRPFVCDVCGKNFKQRASLHVHKMFHSDTYRFECTNCGKKFRRQQDLKVHGWLHTGHRPHSCHQCKAAFRLKHDLNRHLRIHEKRVTCVCGVCEAVFSRERHLKLHEKIHEGVKVLVETEHNAEGGG